MTNFSSRPYYIKSVLIDGSVIGHEVCFALAGEFCMAPHYCPENLASNASFTGLEIAYKLSKDIYLSTGLNYSCDKSSNGASCSIASGLRISATTNGNVSVGSCSISGAGVASC